jgi:hypothetical protein
MFKEGTLADADDDGGLQAREPLSPSFIIPMCLPSASPMKLKKMGI